MQRRNFLKSIGLLSATATVPVTGLLAANERYNAVGIKGKVTGNGKPLAGVVVTDGFNVVTTGKDGNYAFTAHSNAEFVYLSLPSGYEVPNDAGVARFYKSLDKSGMQQRMDFALTALAGGDDKHAFIVWGDTQIQSAEDANLLKTISAPDTKALVQSLGNIPVHGIGVGDLVFDKFELFPDYKQAVGITGAPFFQVIGNHDIDLEARTDEGSQATYKAEFGPTYYSFNRGKIHYVVLDNVFFIGTAKKYIGYITETQLSWLEKDLAHVPAGSTVVVSVHIPTDNEVRERAKAKEDNLSGVTSNRSALYALLKKYKVHIMSGHTHFNENWEKENIMEHNHGTVCGAWWSGPICGDGTPAGYGVYEVNGEDITWYYKSVGHTKDHQLKIHAKGSLQDHPGAVVVNVWNWDSRWKVEWLEDGQVKGMMTQITAFDPEAVALYKGPSLPQKHKWVEPNLTSHLFTAVPSPTAKKFGVRATDRFGKAYSGELTLA